MMRKDARLLDMTVGRPLPLVVRFAIPMLLGAIFDLMYNMVDAIVLGKFVSAEALAAVGASTAPMSMIIMLGNGLTLSFSVLISQAWGAKNISHISKLTAHSAMLCVAFSLLVGGVACAVAPCLLALLNVPENIIEDAALYMRILCGMTIARMLYNTTAAILRAIGDSRRPLYFLILSSVLNIVLDLLFVLGFGMSVVGVAWATVIAQMISAVICCIYMWKKYEILRFGKRELHPDPKLVERLGRIALPMMMTDMMLTGGGMVISSVVNGFGSDVVAAHMVGAKVEQVALIAVGQLASAFAFFAGQNYGARKFDRIMLGMRQSVLAMIGVTALSSAVLFAFGRQLALIFVKAEEAEVLSNALDMIRVEAAFLPALGVILMYNFTLRGIGFIRPAVISSLVELVCKVGLSVVLSRIFGSVGIWYAAPIGWVVGLCFSATFFYRGKWKTNVPEDDAPVAAEG